MRTAAATLAAISAFLLAGLASAAVAFFAATRIEMRSVETVAFAMREEGFDWVGVSADGLRVILEGTAPDEAARFRAISRAASLVDADRVVDSLDVVTPEEVAPPAFALEILRNSDGISLIGLVPAATGREEIASGIAAVAVGVEVTNMVETADYPLPPRWQDALDFGLTALRTLPRAKISVYEDRVEIEAVSQSPQERDAFLTALRDARPDGVDVVLDISAPRPVITPFTLRYVRTPDGGRFEACSADTLEARRIILEAARETGLTGRENCRIGLGVPSPQWGEAVATALRELARLESGTITFSDADVTLLAGEGTPQDLFDLVMGDLDASLPDVFSLHGVLPEPDEDEPSAGPPFFSATLSEVGQVQLRGRLPDDRVTGAVRAYARALFGHDDTYVATRTDDALPAGWATRTLAALEALGMLDYGSVRVEPETVLVSGTSGSQDAVSDITRLLSDRLGEAANFEIDVTYEESLDPLANIPTPEECVARIDAILDETKITFDPGSVEINETAGEILDRIAEILPDCRHARMEIGGHTDSQGRESMNLSLSQARADAVLNGLLARGVLVSNITARGYGESQPIADNATEEGREINRRIEFRLIDENEGEASGEGEAAETGGTDEQEASDE